MRCERAKALGVESCDVCKDATICEIGQHYIKGFFDDSFAYGTEKILGKTKVSPNHQIALIKEVRPWIPAQPGDYLQYRKLRNGMVIIELSKDDVDGGEK